MLAMPSRLLGVVIGVAPIPPLATGREKLGVLGRAGEVGDVGSTGGICCVEGWVPVEACVVAWEFVERGCTLTLFCGEFLASERAGKGGEVDVLGEPEIEFLSSERGGMGRPPDVLLGLGIGSEVSGLIGGGGGGWY